MREQACPAATVRTPQVSRDESCSRQLAHDSGSLTRGSRIPPSARGCCCVCRQPAASGERLWMQLAREMNYLLNYASLIQTRIILAEGKAKNNG